MKMDEEGCGSHRARDSFYHSGMLIGMTSRRRSECRRGQSARSPGGPGRLVSKLGTFPPATPIRWGRVAGAEPPYWVVGTGVQSATRVCPTADKHRLGCFVFSAGMESLTLRSRHRLEQRTENRVYALLSETSAFQDRAVEEYIRVPATLRMSGRPAKCRCCVASHPDRNTKPKPTRQVPLLIPNQMI